AYTLGLNYNSPRYWYANINANYFDRTYLDVNPARLTASAVEFVEPGSAQWERIRGQEKLPAYFTLDVFGGTSIKVNKYIRNASIHMYVYFYFDVNNIISIKNIRTGGFQQMRFDIDTKNVVLFAGKNFYGYGVNYFVNLTLK